jgi:hypothetical protein
MRFYGNIGFGLQTETAPGVWDDIITEKSYFGDVVRTTRRLSDGTEVLPDISVSNSISVVADAFAAENFIFMKYVIWNGVRWVINTAVVQRPRIVLELGGVYNGPTP